MVDIIQSLQNTTLLPAWTELFGSVSAIHVVPPCFNLHIPVAWTKTTGEFALSLRETVWSSSCTLLPLNMPR